MTKVACGSSRPARSESNSCLAASPRSNVRFLPVQGNVSNVTSPSSPSWSVFRSREPSSVHRALFAHVPCTSQTLIFIVGPSQTAVIMNLLNPSAVIDRARHACAARVRSIHWRIRGNFALNPAWVMALQFSFEGAVEEGGEQGVQLGGGLGL